MTVVDIVVVVYVVLHVKSCMILLFFYFVSRSNHISAPCSLTLSLLHELLPFVNVIIHFESGKVFPMKMCM